MEVVPIEGMCMQTTDMDILALYVIMVGDKMKLMLFAGMHIKETRTYNLFSTNAFLLLDN